MPNQDDPIWVAAKLNYDQAEFRDALKLFQAFFAKYPADDLVQFYLGILNLEFNDFLKAHHHFLDYLHQHPGDATAWLGLALTYKKLEKQEVAAARCFAQIANIELFFQAKQNFSKHAPAFLELINSHLTILHTRLATVAYTEGRFEEVRHHVNAILELSADNIEAHHLLALSYSAAEKFSNALHELYILIKKPLEDAQRTELEKLFLYCFEKAKAANEVLPFPVDIHAARLYNLNQQYSHAIIYLDAVLQYPEALTLASTINEERVIAYLGSATEACAKQDFAKARTFYNKVLAIYPLDITVSLQIAISYVKELNYKKALRLFHELLDSPIEHDHHASINMHIMFCLKRLNSHPEETLTRSDASSDLASLDSEHSGMRP